MRTLLVLVTYLSFSLLCPLITNAAEFLSGQDVTIAADETWDGDVYISAQSVNIAGTVKGDLVVCAQKLHVTGTIEGGVFAACQQILLEGECGRTCRLASQVAEVGEGAKLDGDLVAAGYSLTVNQDAVISGDLVYAGFQTLLRGEIARNVWAAVNGAELFGGVGGELSITTAGSHAPDPLMTDEFWPGTPLVKIPRVPSGLTIHDSATVGSKLIYNSPSEADISAMAKVTGPIEWIEPASPGKEPQQKMDYAWQQIKRFLTILAMGVLMIVVCPQTTGGVVEQIIQRPIASFLAGIVAVPLSVVMSVLVIALIVAIPMGFGWLDFDGLAVAGSFIASFAAVTYLGSLAFYFVFGAAVITCITLGRVVFSDHRITSRGPMILMLGFGLIFYVVLTCVPFLGMGIFVTAILFGFGGIFLWFMGKVLAGSAENRPRAATDGK